MVVSPSNSAEIIKRVAKRFNISADDVINISGTNKSFLVSLYVQIIDWFAVNHPPVAWKFHVRLRSSSDTRGTRYPSIAEAD